MMMMRIVWTSKAGDEKAGKLENLVFFMQKNPYRTVRVEM